MARTKGTRNKNTSLPDAFSLKTDERILLLANLIVDRIMADQSNVKEHAEATNV